MARVTVALRISCDKAIYRKRISPKLNVPSHKHHPTTVGKRFLYAAKKSVRPNATQLYNIALPTLTVGKIIRPTVRPAMSPEIPPTAYHTGEGMARPIDHSSDCPFFRSRRYDETRPTPTVAGTQTKMPPIIKTYSTGDAASFAPGSANIAASSAYPRKKTPTCNLTGRGSSIRFPA